MWLSLMVGCTVLAPTDRVEHGGGGVRIDLGPIHPGARYLFYLHAKIVEEQGLPAMSPEHGEYQYAAILDRLASFGFVVVSEVRAQDASSVLYAQRIAAQVDSLLDAGVPPEHVTVVGASKGAYIAALVSHRVPTPGVRYVILSMCDAETVAYMMEQGTDLHGDVLALRDAADTPDLVGSCEDLFAFSREIGRHNEIVVDVGTGHGILYQPLDAWVLPTVRWARGAELGEAFGTAEPAAARRRRAQASPPCPTVGVSCAPIHR